MSENNKFTEEETRLLNSGFLNAIGGIHQKLDDNEKKVFEAMLNKAFKDEGSQILKDGIQEAANPSMCPPDCVFVRGMGCICD